MHDLLCITARPDLADTKKRNKHRKTPQVLVSAAVSIPPTLYNAAIKEARQRHENNFSRYVRSLITKDLGAA